MSIHGIPGELTLAAVWEHGAARVGCAPLASLDVLAMGDRLPFAGGLLAPCRGARGAGLPVRCRLWKRRGPRARAP